MARRCLAAAAATVGLVAAQPTTTIGGCDASGKQQIAMVNWFEAAGCRSGGVNEHRTIVSAPLDICHTVPNSTLGGYAVTCRPDGSGGLIQFCSTNRCGECDVTIPFSNFQCIPDLPARYGSMSVSIDCFGQNEAALPRQVKPSGDDFSVTWYEAPGCQDGLCPENHFTVVVGPQDLCHVVPDVPASSGYRVKCDPDGTTGIFQVCADSVCSQCDEPLRFATQQCLANPIIYGSASMEFHCPGDDSTGTGPEATATPPPAPSQAPPSAGGDPGSGGETPPAVTFAPPGGSQPGSGSGPGSGPGSETPGGGQPPQAPQCPAEALRKVANINWFAKGDCTTDATGTGRVTVVSAEIDICHTVPAAAGFDNRFGGYKAACNTDGSGALQFYETNKCDGAFNSTSFGGYSCVSSDPRFGSSSVSVDCFARNEPVLPPGAQPHPSFFTATWFADDTCRRGQCPQGHFTVVEGGQGICHTVPNSKDGGVSNTGYRVVCGESANVGFFQACEDSACSKCDERVPFQGGQCLANPPEFGSRSVVFQCARGPEPDSSFVGIFGPVIAPAPQGASGAMEVTVAGTVFAVGVGAAAARARF